MWGGGLPCPFLKIERSALNLEKRNPDCVHLCVKFSIQNIILRVSRRKNSKMFHCRAFFLVFLCNGFRSALVSQNLSYLVACWHSGIILFAKRSILNVWKSSEYSFLNNCSVICTVTLRYCVRHIQNSDILRTHSDILRHI